MDDNFIPQCPFRNDAPCDRRCALSVWQKKDKYAFCALAVSVAIGKPDLSINALILPDDAIKTNGGK